MARQIAQVSAGRCVGAGLVPALIRATTRVAPTSIKLPRRQERPGALTVLFSAGRPRCRLLEWQPALLREVLLSRPW